MGYALKCPRCGKEINSDEVGDVNNVTCPDCETFYTSPVRGLPGRRITERVDADTAFSMFVDAMTRAELAEHVAEKLVEKEAEQEIEKK